MRTKKPPRRVLRREPATIDQAVDLATRGSNPGGSSALVLCTRVGEADFVPPRYEVAPGSECGAPCWRNPDVAESARRRGMGLIVFCFHCVGGGQPS
jgi:hypothetical protein